MKALSKIPRQAPRPISDKDYKGMWKRIWLVLLLPLVYLYQLVGLHYEGTNKTFRGFNETFFDELSNYLYGLVTKKDRGRNPNLEKREVYRKCQIKRYGYHSFFEEMYGQDLYQCGRWLRLSKEKELVYNYDGEWREHLVVIHRKGKKYDMVYKWKNYRGGSNPYEKRVTGITEEKALAILKEGTNHIT